LCREQLKSLIDSGATLTEMAAQLDRSVSTVRYWLARHEIKSSNPRVPDGGTAMAPRQRSSNVGDMA
jgi:IS30 family transposase